MIVEFRRHGHIYIYVAALVMFVACHRTKKAHGSYAESLLQFVGMIPDDINIFSFRFHRRRYTLLIPRVPPHYVMLHSILCSSLCKVSVLSNTCKEKCKKVWEISKKGCHKTWEGCRCQTKKSRSILHGRSGFHYCNLELFGLSFFSGSCSLCGFCCGCLGYFGCGSSGLFGS